MRVQHLDMHLADPVVRFQARKTWRELNFLSECCLADVQALSLQSLTDTQAPSQSFHHGLLPTLFLGHPHGEHPG